ncbi:hypothetical protein GJV85_12580 [Sulfurimonas aquatica]|uniref:Uncharacterized protein n=1 Tax=Sulfurimonas aquatica TaxID=2672570 RepID=A0A975GDS8_9BACT|nr:hypothetical protein [Sulfurimonas aquatica]QSZ42907.1 hypothetical protein GJV85_12580 [Sulfurimonas aquatica]
MILTKMNCMYKRLISALKETNNRWIYGKEISDESVENFLGTLALLYAAANVDEIDKTEQQVVALYKYNMKRALDRPDKKGLRDIFYGYSHMVNEIESMKHTIKLSEALEYFPHSESGVSPELKESLIELTSEVIDVDGKITKKEEEFRERLCIYIQKGYPAVKEIRKLEA